MLYILNLQTAICQLYLNKTRGGGGEASKKLWNAKHISKNASRIYNKVIQLNKRVCLVSHHVRLFVTLWSPSGSSVHGILQARLLELVAIPFFRGSSGPPRDWIWVSCLASGFFTVWTTKENPIRRNNTIKIGERFEHFTKEDT